MYPTRPAGVIELLDRAVRLYRDQFGLALSVVAVLMIPLNVMLAVTLEIALGPIYSAVKDLGTDFSKIGELVTEYGGVQLFLTAAGVTMTYLLLYGLVAPLASGALFIALNGRMRGEPMTVGRAYRGLFGVMGPYVGAVMIKGSVVVLGYLFCVVPGIVLGLLLSQVEPVVLLERRSSMDAVGRSWELMRGASTVLRLLGVVFLLVLTSVIAGQIAGFGYVLVTGGPPGSFLSSTLLSAAPEMLLLPLDVAAILLFYYDLRVRREAFDLELEATRLGLIDAPTPPPPREGGPPLP